MFEHYGDGEVKRALEQLHADMMRKDRAVKQAAFLSAALNALSDHESDADSHGTQNDREPGNRPTGDSV